MYEALKARLAERGLRIDETKLTNRTALVAKLQNNLADNKVYLALTSPTAAQNTAQIKALTRQVNRLIRLQVNDLTAAE